MIGLDKHNKCSIFVLMLQGYPISTFLPEETGFGDRFWYWCGASGTAYIHSIYKLGFHPPVSHAIFILVSLSSGVRRAVAAGRLNVDGTLPSSDWYGYAGSAEELEVHMHLLARDGIGREQVRRDILAAFSVSERAYACDGMPFAQPCRPVHGQRVTVS